MFNHSRILPHNGFNNLFPTVQETNHFMEVGWLEKKKKKKKIKCMVMYQYPTCDMHSCIVKNELISEISFGFL